MREPDESVRPTNRGESLSCLLALRCMEDEAPVPEEKLGVRPRTGASCSPVLRCVEDEVRVIQVADCSSSKTLLLGIDVGVETVETVPEYFFGISAINARSCGV